MGQRGWNSHPLGGSSGLAGSPCRRVVRRARSGHSRQQRLGVRVGRRGTDLLGRPALDDPAQVHHGDAVGHDPGRGQVVGDEEDGDAELPAQLRR